MTKVTEKQKQQKLQQKKQEEEDKKKIYKYLPPTNTFQANYRNEMKKTLSHIKEPHCMVCGDTDEQCKIVEIPTNVGIKILCTDCFAIQKNM
jgi:esterase/lipase